jgi:hypothetical protein
MIDLWENHTPINIHNLLTEQISWTFLFVRVRGGDTFNPDDMNILRYSTLRGSVKKI